MFCIENAFGRSALYIMKYTHTLLLNTTKTADSIGENKRNPLYKQIFEGFPYLLNFLKLLIWYLTIAYTVPHE